MKIFIAQQNYHIGNFEYNTNERLDTGFLNELALQLEQLDKKGVQWLMTQADTIEVRNKFANYTILEFPVFRSRSRTHKNELIIKNY